MSLAALAITAAVGTLSAGPHMVSCTFPATAPGEGTIRVAVEARPSLMDVDERYRISLHLGDEGEAPGLAQPIDRTEERDVLIRARASNDLVYTIGLRDDGRAALNLLRIARSAGGARTETREGHCHDHRPLLNAWLRS